VNLIQSIARHAAKQPRRVALEHPRSSLDYAALERAIEALANELARKRIRTLGLDLDNGPGWALVDLAALSAGIQLVPIPPFFSPQQVRHCIEQAGIQAIVSDRPGQLAARAGALVTGSVTQFELPDERQTWVEATGDGQRVPAGVAKVTYTSGTTGSPKGVMLDWEQMGAVVESLAQRVEVSTDDRHLALAPLAVLLENICGLYTPLWCGATAVLPSLAETGLLGASGLDAARMADSLGRYQATTAIFSPQTLQGLVEYLDRGGDALEELRFAAVGGAPVSRKLLQRAQALGLPVREGYGLSECASVTTLNTAAANKTGSAGLPLPHLRLRIAEDGEVLVAGNLYRGYLGEAAPATENGWWHSGDIGHLDDDGFLHLTGRKHNIFITAFGRNVAPEWVERELVLEPAIAQAAVFGEARPWNAALVVPTPGADTEEISKAVSRTNASLPDYARIRRWLPADEPFSTLNGELSGTGRVKRQNILARYCGRIESLYPQELAS